MMDLEGLRKLNQNKVTHCKPTYSHKPSISHNLFLQAIYFTYFHKQFISHIITSNLFHLFSQAIYFTYSHKQFISHIITSNLFHIFSQVIYFTAPPVAERLIDHSIISPLCLVWVRAPLWPRETSQVLLAGVSGGFSWGSPVFAPPTDWPVSYELK